MGDWIVPGMDGKCEGVGSAVAPLGMIGIGRGDGFGDRSQRAAKAWAGVRDEVERRPRGRTE